MRRVPSGLAGLGGLQGVGGEQPSKRQKRADVLDSLGGLSVPSSLGQRAATSGRSGGQQASNGGIGGFGKNASAADLEAMKAWLTDTDADAAGGAKSKQAGSVAAPVASTPTSSSSASAEHPAEVASTATSVTDAPVPVAICPDTNTSAASTDTTGDTPPPDSVTPAPFRLVSETAKLWCSIFSQAKDRWDTVDEDTARSVFWHSGSGCCFEWHQDIGVLLQYGEEDEKGLPQKFPIWSLDCPEQSAWIWDTLPLPPTDPASQTAKQPAASESTEAPSNGEENCKAVSAAAALMPPPPVPFKKRGRPEVISKPRPVTDDEDDDDDEGSRSLHNEVLDDNVWERRCRNLERRAAVAASSSASASAAPEAASSGRSEVAAALAAGKAALAFTGECDDEPDIAVPVVQRPRGPLEEDSDDDVAEDAGLAAQGPLPELPSAPADRAKPKACDLDMDMFGDPEEDSMEAVD